MKIIQINAANIDDEHICCAIGNDKQNRARAQTKKEWLKKRFDEGLIFKRLDQRGKVFIEYLPVEKGWKPINGRNYMLIHCLWVSGQFKGKGFSKQLLNECIQDARSLQMQGVVVVTSDKVKPFLTDKSFYLKNGFEKIDSAVPYFELLALNFHTQGPLPEFTTDAKNGVVAKTDGLTLVYSNQCPFMKEYAQRCSEMSGEFGLPCKLIKLESYQDAQKYGSPFGTLGVYYQGKFQTHEVMSEAKLAKFLATL